MKNHFTALMLCFISFLFVNCGGGDNRNDNDDGSKGVDAVMVGKFKAITRAEVEKEIDDFKYDLKATKENRKLKGDDVRALELIDRISVDDCMDYLQKVLDERGNRSGSVNGEKRQIKSKAQTQYPDIYFLDEECCFLWGVQEQAWAYQNLLGKELQGWERSRFLSRGDKEALREFDSLKAVTSSIQ